MMNWRKSLYIASWCGYLAALGLPAHTASSNSLGINVLIGSVQLMFLAIITEGWGNPDALYYAIRLFSLWILLPNLLMILSLYYRTTIWGAYQRRPNVVVCLATLISISAVISPLFHKTYTYLRLTSLSPEQLSIGYFAWALSVITMGILLLDLRFSVEQ